MVVRPPNSNPDFEPGDDGDDHHEKPESASPPVQDRSLRTLPPAFRIKDLAEANFWRGSQPYNETPGIFTYLSKPGKKPGIADRVELPTHFSNALQVIYYLEILEIPRDQWPEGF